MAMTDRVRFAGRSFDLVRVVGPPLFAPSIHGIVVVAGLSPCPRGFYGIYDLEPRLTLQRLHVRLTDDALPAALAGVRPTRRERRTRQLVEGRWTPGVWPAWDHVYRGLELPRRFTGSLWLGADRIPRTGWPDEPLLAYRTVWDIYVEDGGLIAAIERSSEVAGARARRRRSEATRAVTFDQLH